MSDSLLGRVLHAYPIRQPHQIVTARERQAYAALIDAIMTDGHTIPVAFGQGGWARSWKEEPYIDHDEMVRGAANAAAGGSAFLVSDLNHNGAFLGRNAHNLLFRAHHDAIHVLTGHRAFDFEGEARTCCATLRALNLSWDSDAACVLGQEVIGQAAYHINTGRFPVMTNGRQPAAFVDDRMVEKWTGILRSGG